MDLRIAAAVQRLPGSATNAESRAGRIGPITLGVKQTGERRAGNPHTAFEVAGAGNVAWSRCCDTRRRKGETTGNTNFDLHRRASPRPYRENLAGDAKGKSTSGSNREAEENYSSDLRPDADRTMSWPRQRLPWTRSGSSFRSLKARYGSTTPAIPARRANGVLIWSVIAKRPQRWYT